MKNITLLLTVVLLTASFTALQAQSKFKQSKFSISIQGGAFLPMGDLAKEYNIGGNAGLGLNYKVKPNIEIYAEGNYNFMGYKTSSDYGYVGSYNGKPSIFDGGIGVRFFFGQSKFKTFVEGGAGIYMFNTPSMTYTLYFINVKTGDTTYYTFTDASRNSTNFGLHAGLGEIFNVAKNVDLYLRSDFRAAISGSDEGITSFKFFEVYAGAKFGF
jgi:hypothetical protein